MKRELGIARCGLACCLCAEHINCKGCHAEDCEGKEWCENRHCSIEKGLTHCLACMEQSCRKGILQKEKSYALNAFAKKYGVEMLLDCLEKMRKSASVIIELGSLEIMMAEQWKKFSGCC
ncbi:MAG: DUF3795 domain-containing protein [Ruminococcus sp.]